jgi:hypothetical protein
LEYKIYRKTWKRSGGSYSHIVFQVNIPRIVWELSPEYYGSYLPIILGIFTKLPKEFSSKT